MDALGRCGRDRRDVVVVVKILVVKMAAAACFHLLSLHVPYHYLISRLACREHINPRVVAAIVKQESNFNPHAIGHDSGGNSRGLMQIKWTTAKWLGFHGSKRDLLNSIINLKLGIRYLAIQARKHPYGTDAISSYNLGTPVYIHGYGYRNRAYVMSVWRNYRRLH